MIPVATHIVRVERFPDGTVARGVRAVIGRATGVATTGASAVVTYALHCDSISSGINAEDYIVDEKTNDTYYVNWAAKRTGLGLDHWQADIVRVDPIQVNGVVTVTRSPDDWDADSEETTVASGVRVSILEQSAEYIADEETGASALVRSYVVLLPVGTDVQPGDVLSSTRGEQIQIQSVAAIRGEGTVAHIRATGFHVEPATGD